MNSQNKEQLQERFVIDRENDLVHEIETGITSELVQTSVSLIRNEKREIIGTEVLHLCRAEDEPIFVIDDTVFEDPHDSEL